ncbi:ADP-ribosylation factor GTPase-activating protein 2-like isoform X2 [Gigantopelta aegis]|uniref:ADP-ribosylation factor GTPase-activating protein 2-like isoform X2 n=1 Tax=Gigantopelta aegis TaxID=1735272 RepID=UPI001B889201|nr:ADP-ribosylation factor GTPase-activating protein 2-like isoform X2 [Gigantopelta aegis]
MAEQPSKADITTIFKRLRSIPANKQCFDCNHSNPTWASVTYGVFLCIDCSAVHRSLGVHITFIRSTQLDTNWTWLQLRAMQVGGNANAYAFFHQHGCDSTDAQKKYHSRAAHLYREKLLTRTQNALRLHGTKLHIDSVKEPTSPREKEEDFFNAHTKIEEPVPASIADGEKLFSTPKPVSNGNARSTKDIDPNEGPKVDHVLSMSPTEAIAVAEPRKTIIGAKKTAAARKGKSGFGAQRVKTNFNEIENRAQQLDKEREDLVKMNEVKNVKTKEEQETQMASMRLAYKDMSLERKKQEDKLKAADPQKAVQFERLGMGFAGNKGISHSAVFDMQTIEQESPHDNDRGGGRYGRKANKWGRDKDFFEDEIEMFGGGFSKGFGDGSYGSKKDSYGDSSYGSKNDDFGTWGNPNKGGSWDIDRFESKQSKSETMASKQDDSNPEPMETDDDWPSRNRKTYEPATSTEAQQRFGSAKAISSDTYFGNKDPDFESRQALSRLEGKSGISSDDVFGTNKPSKPDYYSNTPDLQDIKDGVREGVTKVAGKLSSLANGVMNSLQRKK